MHDLLLLLSLLKNQYDVRVQPESDESTDTTRQAQREEFKVQKSRLRKTYDNVFSTNQNTSVQGLRIDPDQNYTEKNQPSFL